MIPRPPRSTLFPYTTSSDLPNDDPCRTRPRQHRNIGDLVWTRRHFLRMGFRIVDKDIDRKSTRLNSSHANISYAVFCLKKKKQTSNYLHIYALTYTDDNSLS